MPQEPRAPEAGPPGEPATSDLLQSMLSRAAEGQVTEQRQLTGAVNDMRTQLMRLSQELAELRVRPPQDDSSDAQINTVTVEMREAVRFLSERLDGVTRMVAQRGEELADIRTALTAIDAHVRSQAETIGVLSNGLQALPSYGERVSVLQDNLQVLHRQLVGIEESIATAPGESALAEKLAAIETTIAPLTSRLDEVSDIGTAQSALLSQLQTAASQVQQSVAGLHETVAPLAGDITAIGAGVTGLVEGSADGAALDSRVSESVRDAIAETETRLMAHVDEAVLALAQTLMRRRPPTTASQITGTPIVEAEPAEPEPLAPPEEPAEPGPVGSTADDAPGDSQLDTESSPATEPEPAGPAGTDLPQVGVLDEPEDSSEEPAGPPEQAGAGDDEESDPDATQAMSPPNAMPPPNPSDRAADSPAAPAAPWTPETPPERDPADPTVTFDEGKKKRRWGRSG
jgi:predicted  nucleic acid-binding Zn-ribbon protein